MNTQDYVSTFGLQFIDGNRDLECGIKGMLDRLQFSKKHSFSFATITNISEGRCNNLGNSFIASNKQEN